MRKSALSMLLALVMFWASLSQVHYANAAEESDYSYTIDGDGATITDFPRGAVVDIIIPDTLGGVPVTAIGDTAFYIIDLTSVVFPDSLKSIGNDAFGFNFLTSIDIPDGVTSIGERAFKDNLLTSVDIPDSVTSVGQEVFSNNLITRVNIPDSLTSISDFAFRGNQLTSVVIPDGVTSIGGYAFRYNLLTSVTLLNESTVIDNLAFNNNQTIAADLKIFGSARSAVQNYARSKGYTFVDGTVLFAAMDAAKQLLSDHMPGTNEGQVPALIHDGLKDALADARLFVDGITGTTVSTDLEPPAALLNAAIDVFTDAIIPPPADAAALEAAIALA
ncbi:leucine-rich repeat domain-containing protein, partial [Paenibacillus sepulcri]|nr:leucine-rich repeat domain-containing protein [Paenibacillus sepulcri]